MLLNFTRHFYFKKGKFPAWIVAEASKEAEGSVVILFFLKRRENLTNAFSRDWSVNKNLNSAAHELKNFAIAIVTLDSPMTELSQAQLKHAARINPDCPCTQRCLGRLIICTWDWSKHFVSLVMNKTIRVSFILRIASSWTDPRQIFQISSSLFSCMAELLPSSVWS